MKFNLLTLFGCSALWLWMNRAKVAPALSRARPASFKCKRAVNWYFRFELYQKLPHDLAGNSLQTFNLLFPSPSSTSASTFAGKIAHMMF